MFTITLNNSGGELESRTAETAEQAATVAAEMIAEVGVMYDGDTLVIKEDE